MSQSTNANSHVLRRSTRVNKRSSDGVVSTSHLGSEKLTEQQQQKGHNHTEEMSSNLSLSTSLRTKRSRTEFGPIIETVTPSPRLTRSLKMRIDSLSPRSNRSDPSSLHGNSIILGQSVPKNVYDIFDSTRGSQEQQWASNPSFLTTAKDDVDGTRYESNVIYWYSYGEEYYNHLFEWEKDHPLTASFELFREGDCDWKRSMEKESIKEMVTASVQKTGVRTRSQARMLQVGNKYLNTDVGVAQKEEEELVVAGTSKLEGITTSKQEISLVTQPSDFMSSMPYRRHPEITPLMRLTLVDWLVEVADECKFEPLTLHMGVALLDRVLNLDIPSREDALKNQFFSKSGEYNGVEPVSGDMLQCMGCACMSLAAKQEEIQVPVIDDFVYMCDNSFTADDILELERQVCAEMHFNLKCVTPLHYLDPFVMAACVTTEGELSRNAAPSAEKENDRQHQSKVNHRKRRLLSTMAQYLIDLSLNDATLCVKPSNEVCAAAVVLAKLTLGMQVDGEYPVGWNRTMEYYTRCTFLELKDLICRLRNIQQGAHSSKYSSVYKKYSTKPNFAVALKAAQREEDLKISR